MKLSLSKSSPSPNLVLIQDVVMCKLLFCRSLRSFPKWPRYVLHNGRVLRGALRARYAENLADFKSEADFLWTDLIGAHVAAMRPVGYTRLEASLTPRSEQHFPILANKLVKNFPMHFMQKSPHNVTHNPSIHPLLML